MPGTTATVVPEKSPHNAAREGAVQKESESSAATAASSKGISQSPADGQVTTKESLANRIATMETLEAINFLHREIVAGEDNNFVEKIKKVEKCLIEPVENYTEADIFPLPQYLDLTTQRHVKTRYFRLSVLFTMDFAFVLLLMVYFAYYRVTGVFWIHLNEPLTINTEGCKFIFTSDRRETVGYWAGLAAWMPENYYPARCKENPANPCFLIHYEHSICPSSSVTMKGGTITAKDRGICTTECKLYITYDHKIDPPYAGMTIVSTGATTIDKIQDGVLSRNELSPWLLEMDYFHVNGTEVDISIRNIKTSSLRVYVRRGRLVLLGADLNWRGHHRVLPGYTSQNEISLGTTDLGRVSGVGKFEPSPTSKNSSCVESLCGGDIKTSFINVTRVTFAENDGGVCLTAAKVAKEASSACNSENCSTWHRTVLLCNREEAASGACIANNAAHIKLSTVDGGVFASTPDYSRTKDDYKNDRFTKDNRPCLFPFTFRSQKYYDCTSAKFGSPWCVTTEDAQMDPQLLEQLDEQTHWGYCNEYESFEGENFGNENPAGMTFDAQSTKALQKIVDFENEKENSPVVINMEQYGVRASRGTVQWLYATKLPYLYCRVDYLSLMSLGLLTPRPDSSTSLSIQNPVFVPWGHCLMPRLT
jgi:hypothetical protein